MSFGFQNGISVAAHVNLEKEQPDLIFHIKIAIGGCFTSLEGKNGKMQLCRYVGLLGLALQSNSSNCLALILDGHLGNLSLNTTQHTKETNPMI